MHHVRSLLACARIPLAAALPLLFGCADRGASEIRVVLDTSQQREAQEVIALPFDPSSLQPVEPAAGPRADSVQRLRVLADSAERLDRRFQSEREEINRQALAMRQRDRTTRAYADAYLDLERRTAAAEQVRSARDELRARSSAYAAALGFDTRADAGATVPWDQVVAAARASGRTPVRGAVRDTVVLRAPPGRWWLTLGSGGDHIRARATGVELGQGEQRVVHLTP